jgi:hypothetical protein
MLVDESDQSMAAVRLAVGRPAASPASGVRRARPRSLEVVVLTVEAQYRFEVETAEDQEPVETSRAGRLGRKFTPAYAKRSASAFACGAGIGAGSHLDRDSLPKVSSNRPDIRARVNHDKARREPLRSLGANRADGRASADD